MALTRTASLALTRLAAFYPSGSSERRVLLAYLKAAGAGEDHHARMQFLGGLMKQTADKAQRNVTKGDTQPYIAAMLEHGFDPEVAEAWMKRGTDFGLYTVVQRAAASQVGGMSENTSPGAKGVSGEDIAQVMSFGGIQYPGMIYDRKENKYKDRKNPAFPEGQSLYYKIGEQFLKGNKTGGLRQLKGILGKYAKSRTKNWLSSVDAGANVKFEYDPEGQLVEDTGNYEPPPLEEFLAQALYLRQINNLMERSLASSPGQLRVWKGVVDGMKKNKDLLKYKEKGAGKGDLTIEAKKLRMHMVEMVEAEYGDDEVDPTTDKPYIDGVPTTQGLQKSFSKILPKMLAAMEDKLALGVKGMSSKEKAFFKDRDIAEVYRDSIRRRASRQINASERSAMIKAAVPVMEKDIESALRPLGMTSFFGHIQGGKAGMVQGVPVARYSLTAKGILSRETWEADPSSVKSLYAASRKALVKALRKLNVNGVVAKVGRRPGRLSLDTANGFEIDIYLFFKDTDPGKLAALKASEGARDSIRRRASRQINASERSAMIRLAATLPVGSPERKIILAGCEKMKSPAMVQNCEDMKAGKKPGKGKSKAKSDDKKDDGKMPADLLEKFKAKKAAAAKKVKMTFTEHTDVPATIKGKKEMDMFKKGEGINGEIVSEDSKNYTIKNQRGFLYEVPKKSVTVKKAGKTIGKGKNGYIAMYKRKQVEVMADTQLEARDLAAKHFRARKPYEVNVMLAEKGGKQVTHMPMFASKKELPEALKKNQFTSEDNPNPKGNDKDGDGKTNEPSPVPKKAAPALTSKVEKVLARYRVESLGGEVEYHTNFKTWNAESGSDFAFTVKWSEGDGSMGYRYQLREMDETLEHAFGKLGLKPAGHLRERTYYLPEQKKSARVKSKKASKKAALVRLAATLPVGSSERKTILRLASE